jgi:flagellar FliL protein
MAETEETAEAAPKKKSKLPLVIGLVLAIVLGAGGFYATWSGMVMGGKGDSHAEMDTKASPLPDIAFVPVDPIIVSLGRSTRNQHLRFSSQLEVNKPNLNEVTMLLPRILDVLNGYLRAIDVSQLEDPAALVRIRAHMLRRIQIVTGEGRVRDLLITEFVLN